MHLCIHRYIPTHMCTCMPAHTQHTQRRGSRLNFGSLLIDSMPFFLVLYNSRNSYYRMSYIFLHGCIHACLFTNSTCIHTY